MTEDKETMGMEALIADLEADLKKANTRKKSLETQVKNLKAQLEDSEGKLEAARNGKAFAKFRASDVLHIATARHPSISPDAALVLIALLVKHGDEVVDIYDFCAKAGFPDVYAQHAINHAKHSSMVNRLAVAVTGDRIKINLEKK